MKEFVGIDKFYPMQLNRILGLNSNHQTGDVGTKHPSPTSRILPAIHRFKRRLLVCSNFNLFQTQLLFLRKTRPNVLNWEAPKFVEPGFIDCKSIAQLMSFEARKLLNVRSGLKRERALGDFTATVEKTQTYGGSSSGSSGSSSGSSSTYLLSAAPLYLTEHFVTLGTPNPLRDEFYEVKKRQYLDPSAPKLGNVW